MFELLCSVISTTMSEFGFTVSEKLMISSAELMETLKLWMKGGVVSGTYRFTSIPLAMSEQFTG